MAQSLSLLPLPLLLVVLLLLLGQSTSDNVTAASRIVGGDPVPSPNPYPWMVQLIFRDSNLDAVSLCGGSIIKPKTILTAAHCVYGQTPFGISFCTSLVSGLYEPLSPLCVFDIHAKITIYPSYDSSAIKNDIAIIVTSVDIPMSIEVPKYPILASSQPSVGTVVTVAGWGLTTDGGDVAKVLRYVNLKVQASSVCQNQYPTEYAPTVEMCAGVTGGGKDSCQGDSGGPLFVINDNCKYPGVTQIGIVSYGAACASTSGAVYTRVDAFREWIESEVGKIDNTPACCTCEGSWGSRLTVTGKIIVTQMVILIVCFLEWF